MALQNKSRLFVKSKNLKNITIPILFVLTFFLIFFNKTDYYIVEKFKTHSLDYIIPTAKIIAYPVNFAKKTRNGTIINPPPIPMNPLKKPPMRPVKIKYII